MKYAAVLAGALSCVGIDLPANPAPGCQDLEHRGRSFTVCTVDVSETPVRLFLRRDDGGPHASFSSVNATLSQEGKSLGVAMNAGMYHSDRRPVGLYIEDGTQEQRLITSAGPGNFGLLPNGVFCIGPDRSDVIETRRYEATRPNCNFATQSGPMLVIGGALHPRFLPDSSSRYVRNGVGTDTSGQIVHFAISNDRVTFHEFGTLFKDVLNVPNALYFDGNISRLHAPEIGRSDAGFAMGPIVGTVIPKQ